MRETGYYWVKYGGYWIIAHFTNNSNARLDKTRDLWQMTGYSDWWSDYDFSEINPEKIYDLEQINALKNQVKMYQDLLNVSTEQKMALVDENKLLQVTKRAKNFWFFIVGASIPVIIYLVL